MKAPTLRVSALLAGLALLLATSCSKNNPTGATGQNGLSTESAAVSSVLASTSSVIDDGLMEAADQTLFSSTGTPGMTGTDALVRPLRFWRRITDVNRYFEFSFSDTDATMRPTKAVVTIHKEMTGTFNLVFDATPDDTMPFDTVAVVHKPLHDLWTRQVLLQRVHRDAKGDMVLGSGEEDDDHDGGNGQGDHNGHHRRDEWKVTGISGADMRSYDPALSTPGSPAFGLTKILKMHIQATSLDTVIEDPLQFFLMRKIHCFGPTEDVKVTVTTASNTDEVVLVRGGGIRHRFHNNGDNTYTMTWHTSLEAGLRHLGVNALSHGTLFDDQSPYDSDAWILPYAIRPTSLAEFLP